MPAASYAAETTGAVRKLYGDANCDGSVNIADAVLVMQVATNPDKYAQGKSEVSISAAGETNADVDGKKGLTNSDALLIQQHKLGLIDKFPVEDVQPQNDAVSIHLGSSITVEGYEAGYVKVSGSVATITHSGTYNIDGTLEDGQICVNIPDEAADPDTVKLFLNGASITGKSAPAILVSNAENTSINLVDGTENTVSDGDTAYAAADGTLTGEAVIEAKDDLTIKGGDLGTGKLTVTANTQDGVFCKNDLKINGGIIDVKALNSTDKTNGLNGKKSLTVKSGTLTVDAEGDGIKSSKGAVTISGGSTSIKAGHSGGLGDGGTFYDLHLYLNIVIPHIQAGLWQYEGCHGSHSAGQTEPTAVDGGLVVGRLPQLAGSSAMDRILPCRDSCEDILYLSRGETIVMEQIPDDVLMRNVINREKAYAIGSFLPSAAHAKQRVKQRGGVSQPVRRSCNICPHGGIETLEQRQHIQADNVALHVVDEIGAVGDIVLT